MQKPTASSLCETVDEFPWVKKYDAGTLATLSYRKVALFTWLDEAANATPNATACIFHNTTITYAQLRKQAEVFAANLRANGIHTGDRVGLMLPNLPQTLISFWGTLKAGAIVCMINPLYMEKELVHQVKDAGVKCLITVDLCWDKVNNLRDQLGIEQYIVTSVSDGLSFPLNWLQRVKSLRDKNRPKVQWQCNKVSPFSLFLKGEERYSCSVEDPENTIALLQYTGGTTGISKGVMLTHSNLTANVEQTAAILHCLAGEPQTIMAVLPLFHVYGLTTCLLLPTLLRAAVVTVPRFVGSELLRDIEKYKVTVLPGAPSLYIAILQQKRSRKYNLSCLRFCISGSAPMPVEYFKKFEEEFNARLIEGYGLTEASPITHLNPALSERRIGTIGLPLPDTEARVVDMEVGMVPVPCGKVGELILRGPQVMKGYWNCPDETSNALRNGWLYTGDIATMDEDGYFSIVDRKKDMIIVGGYNVAPREIDEVLYEHPKVKEAVTVGVPHPSRGETIKAFIVPKDGVTLEKVEIMDWCRKKLANYKVPRQIEFRESLPKTIVGKILRRKLVEEEMAKKENRSLKG